VKETSFLLAVERIVTGIQIDNDLFAICLDKQLTPLRKRVSSIASWWAPILSVTCFLIISNFQSVEGRSAGQRLALILWSTPSCQRILFTDHHGKDRIESQTIMIIEILVARGQPQQTLSNQFGTECSIKSGLRRSLKHPAREREIPSPSSI
jgi:hypothetical protein